MKLTHAGLASHLAAGKLSPVYILTGEEDFLRDLALKEIEAAALDEASRDFNRDAFDGQDTTTTASQILLAANQLPMLGLRRLVIVRRARRFVEPLRRAAEASEESEGSGTDVQALVDYVKDPSPKTVLLLDLESPPDGRRKAWKEIEKSATVVQCDPLKEWEAEGWIGQQAKQRGVGLGREEVRFLAAEIGPDRRRLLGELEKIALYAEGKPVGLDVVLELLGRGRAQHVFKLTDAIAARDGARAVKQLNRLLDEGESPFPILALLDRRIGQLLVAREVPRRELARVLKLPPRVAEDLAAQAKRFEEKELLDAVKALSRTDRALKSSGVSPRLLLEGLVLAIVGRGGASPPK